MSAAARGDDGLPVVFMFGGHGAHGYHMGHELYLADVRVRRWLDEVDRVARPVFGGSVLAKLYNDDKRRTDPLTDLRIAHPAIFMVEYALCRVVTELGRAPDWVVGASVGELVAAVASDALTEIQALTILAEQVEAFCAEPADGGMLAVAAGVHRFDARAPIWSGLELAAVVSRDQFVVSGSAVDLDRAAIDLGRSDVDTYRLPVCYAFHSSRIDPLRARLQRAPSEGFRAPRGVCVSCASARPINHYSMDHLWNAIRLPLQVARTLDFVSGGGPAVVVDLGPASSLATTAARHARSSSSKFLRLLSPFGGESTNLLKLAAAFSGAPAWAG